MGLTPTQKKFREQMKEIKKKNLYYIPEEKKKEIEIEKLKTQTNKLTNIVVIFILIFGAFIIYQFIMPEHMKASIINTISPVKEQAINIKNIATNSNKDNFITKIEQREVFEYYGTYSENYRIYTSFFKANQTLSKNQLLEQSEFILKNVDTSFYLFKDYNVPDDLKDENIKLLEYFVKLKELANQGIVYSTSSTEKDRSKYIKINNEVKTINDEIEKEMIDNFEKYNIEYEIFEDGTIKFQIKVIR